MSTSRAIAVIGAGPAGLMAAETISASGHSVALYDAMPSAARKFLFAGKSGLNITHAEPFADFCRRFGTAQTHLQPALNGLTPDTIRQWADALGAETFAGSSGRVFPKAMKASPLLRAWLQRLDSRGVRLFTRHHWAGFEGGNCLFDTPDGPLAHRFDAIVLALGGASWPRLGADAAWVPLLVEKGVTINGFRPANCGFDVNWSPAFADRHAGAPVKPVTATSPGGTLQGEFVVSATGIEGSLVYAHSAALRDALAATGRAALTVDLTPGRDLGRLTRDLDRQNPKQSLANRLRKGAGIDGVKSALLRELTPEALNAGAAALAAAIKALPLPVLRPRPIAEAISSAGGVAWQSVDERYMLKALPGVFVAGEMLDWEAPTGGYLISACLAIGKAAGEGVLEFLKR